MLLQGGARQIRSVDTASSYAEAGASAIIKEVLGKRQGYVLTPCKEYSELYPMEGCEGGWICKLRLPARMFFARTVC
jgi:hypothetical protein